MIDYTTATFRVTIHTGEQAEIRPMRHEDLPLLMRPEGELDPRWKALRWLCEDAMIPPAYDCLAWLDSGRLFLPADGQGGSESYDARGPQTAYATPVVDAKGHVIEDGRYNARWYDAATGKPAVARSSAPIWSHHTGALGAGNIELRPIVEEN